MEYLYAQTNQVLQDLLTDPDSEELAQFDPDTSTSDAEEEDISDEGFEDTLEEEDPTQPPLDNDQVSFPTPVVVESSTCTSTPAVPTVSKPMLPRPVIYQPEDTSVSIVAAIDC